MSSLRDEGPIYYREIQKNAYLKRVPNENTTSKLLPLSHKKPPLKPMWTLFCVHNGRSPFLEQYPEAESPATLAHRPLWRASLRGVRHVTAGLRPTPAGEYHFLIDTDHGPVRMLAPDWDSMQDWVSTLRCKLHELKLVGKGENVYAPPPAPPPAPPARAAARDPTSPLPPTPPVPPHRVPGIELTPTRGPQPEPPPEPPQAPTPPPPAPADPTPVPPDPTPPEPSPNIDISNWEDDSTPSTSQGQDIPKSVTKICGQNICLDDSILRRKDATDSDEEFFKEIDRIQEAVEGVDFDSEYPVDFKQRVLVHNDKEGGERTSDQPTNITVIQVSNKPPHTAIPVLGPDTDIFNFDFQQKLPVNGTDFVNIVNTETNGYGTVYKDSDYGHLSLTTTVSLTGNDKNDGIYERLCLASTSHDNNSPLPLRKLKQFDKVRKSSLPNLDVNESTYEYLFPNNNKNTTVTLNESHSLVLPREVNSNLTVINSSNTRVNQVSADTTLSNVRVTSEETSNSDTRVLSAVTSNIEVSARVRGSVERSHSQNSYDRSPRRDLIRPHLSPKRNKNESEAKPECQAKPPWRRGLTELSLLSRLRGITQRRQEAHHHENDRSVVSPVKVVHRSRGENRGDSTRRRSSSLTNAPVPPPPRAALVPLRSRQAAALRADQRRGAASVGTILTSDPPVFADYNRQVWVSWWGGADGRCGGRAGDRLVSVAGLALRGAAHARQLLKAQHAPVLDVLFHRVPLAKIYVINKRDLEGIGIKLDNECNITSVEPNSPAARAGLPPPGVGGSAPQRWAVTEVNNRHINLIKGGEEEMNRLSVHGTEVSVLLQPSPLVKKLRAALKANRNILSLR